MKVMAGQHIASSTVKKEWEGVCNTISTGYFVAAFDKWIEWGNHCVEREGDYAEK